MPAVTADYQSPRRPTAMLVSCIFWYVPQDSLKADGMASIPSLPTPLVAVAFNSGAARVRNFVDFWNLQLTIIERELKHQQGNPQSKPFHIDWLQLPKKLIA
jgi:hypothetical protein